MKLLISVLFLIFSQQCFADKDSERTNLANVIKELDHVIAMVDKVKDDAPIDNRISFQYESLKNDLVLIRSGISDHIEKSLSLGRDIKSLKHNYIKKGIQ